MSSLIKRIRPDRMRGNRGQAALEFTIMAAMMLAVVGSIFLFLAVFTEWGWRVLRIIGLEYP